MLGNYLMIYNGMPEQIITKEEIALLWRNNNNPWIHPIEYDTEITAENFHDDSHKRFKEKRENNKTFYINWVVCSRARIKSNVKIKENL